MRLFDIDAFLYYSRMRKKKKRSQRNQNRFLFVVDDQHNPKNTAFESRPVGNFSDNQSFYYLLN